jgi:serine/threonine protein kinase
LKTFKKMPVTNSKKEIYPRIFTIENLKDDGFKHFKQKYWLDDADLRVIMDTNKQEISRENRIKPQVFSCKERATEMPRIVKMIPKPDLYHRFGDFTQADEARHKYFKDVFKNLHSPWIYKLHGVFTAASSTIVLIVSEKCEGEELFKIIKGKEK